MHRDVRESFEIISNRDARRIDASRNHFRIEKNLEYIQYELDNEVDGEDHRSIDE